MNSLKGIYNDLAIYRADKLKTLNLPKLEFVGLRFEFTHCELLEKIVMQSLKQIGYFRITNNKHLCDLAGFPKLTTIKTSYVAIAPAILHSCTVSLYIRGRKERARGQTNGKLRAQEKEKESERERERERERTRERERAREREMKREPASKMMRERERVRVGVNEVAVLAASSALLATHAVLAV